MDTVQAPIAIHDASALSYSVPTNRLLQTLPLEEYESISPYLRAVSLKAKQLFHRQGEIIHEVYFPGGGACSLAKVLEDGHRAEIATVGHEGMIGAAVFFGDYISTSDVFAQADATAQAMPVDAFIREMGLHRAFYNLVIRYSQAFTTQIMQTAVCNGLHNVEQRCCRWLLMTHDRVQDDELELTHEFLAVTLGVRRPTVTLLMEKLRRMGLIEYRRRAITIVNRPALEETSCECYETVKQDFARLLPELRQRGSWLEPRARLE